MPFFLLDYLQAVLAILFGFGAGTHFVVFTLLIRPEFSKRFVNWPHRLFAYFFCVAVFILLAVCAVMAHVVWGLAALVFTIWQSFKLKFDPDKMEKPPVTLL